MHSEVTGPLSLLWQRGFSWDYFVTIIVLHFERNGIFITWDYETTGCWQFWAACHIHPGLTQSTVSLLGRHLSVCLCISIQTRFIYCIFRQKGIWRNLLAPHISLTLLCQFQEYFQRVEGSKRWYCTIISQLSSLTKCSSAHTNAFDTWMYNLPN